MKLETPLAVAKVLTGVQGFDEITGGGLPQGRTSLVIGGPGCGKTVFALQCLVAGARRQEAGIFVAFEESSHQIATNAATFGWDLPGLVEKKLFFLDARLSPDIVMVGDWHRNREYRQLYGGPDAHPSDIRREAGGVCQGHRARQRQWHDAGRAGPTV